MSENLEEFKELWLNNTELDKTVMDIADQIDGLDMEMEKLLDQQDINEEKYWDIYEKMTKEEKDLVDTWMSEQIGDVSWDDELDSWATSMVEEEKEELEELKDESNY